MCETANSFKQHDVLKDERTWLIYAYTIQMGGRETSSCQALGGFYKDLNVALRRTIHDPTFTSAETRKSMEFGFLNCAKVMCHDIRQLAEENHFIHPYEHGVVQRSYNRLESPLSIFVTGLGDSEIIKVIREGIDLYDKYAEAKFQKDNREAGGEMDKKRKIGEERENSRVERLKDLLKPMMEKRFALPSFTSTCIPKDVDNGISDAQQQNNVFQFSNNGSTDRFEVTIRGLNKDNAFAIGEVAFNKNEKEVLILPGQLVKLVRVTAKPIEGFFGSHKILRLELECVDSWND